MMKSSEVDKQINLFMCAVSDECSISKSRQLIDSGIDVNVSTVFGCTALMFAVMPNQYGDHNTSNAVSDIVDFLLDCGASPLLRDNFGMSAEDYARQWIDPNWCDDFGDSALSKLSSEAILTFKSIIEKLERARL